MFRELSRWLHSLQAQLILWAILPVTLVVIGLALTGVYTHQQAMQDFVIERDHVLARMIAQNLEEALAQGRISPTPESLSAWLATAAGDLSGTLMIVDQDGDIVAQTALGASDVRLMFGLSELALSSTGETAVVPTSEGLLIFNTAPIAGTTWQVVIRESARELTGPILRLSGLGPVAAVFAAALSVMILTFGWRTIVSPLQRLSKAAEAVTWGAPAQIDADIQGVAEIEDLRDALSAMVLRLEGYQASVLDYLDAVTQGQEEERARLARELHDGPVQSLIALSQRIEMTERLIDRGDVATACERLERLRDGEIQVIDELRRIIGALRPAYLEDLGFIPGLSMLVRKADQRSTAEVRLQATDELPRLSPDVELAAYRIAQEALSNALQHAYAEHVTVEIQCGDRGLLMQISDDGVGFTPASRLDAYTREGHFGLVGLQERVRQFEGKLDIVSTPGFGTTVTVLIPITAASPNPAACG